MARNHKCLMSMRELSRIIIKILDTDRDFVICVSGIEGEGKSTFSVQLAKLVNNRRFRVEKHVIYSPDDVKKAIYGIEKQAVVADEGMEAFYKRDWNSSKRRSLNTLFSMCRKQNLSVMINIPNFWDLDPYYRNHRVKMWVFVPKRGRAILFGPDRNPFTADRWYQKLNQKVLSKRFRGKIWLDSDTFSDILRASPNYIADVTFKDMDDKTKTKYLDHKNKNFASYEKRMTDAEDKDKNRKRLRLAIKILYNDFGMNQTDIGQTMNFSQQRVCQILRDQGVKIERKKDNNEPDEENKLQSTTESS